MESNKTKRRKGIILLETIIKLAGQAKIKNHFEEVKQFLASWLKLLEKESLVKIIRRMIKWIITAKNFIVERRLAPHFIVIALGLIVALCNVIVARGADELYNLIPADPSTQVDVATSIDHYTPLIINDASSVEKLITLPTDSESSGFAIDVKTTTTSKSERPEEVAQQGPRTKNLIYAVQPGDTLSGLGMRYNVKISSIKFANDLTNIDLIQPGTTIKIPPESWEPSAKEIAAKEKKLAQANRNTVTRSSSSSRSISVDTRVGSKYNGYPYGYCTYYAATRRAIPTSWGNAGQWLNSAKRAGYTTGSEPAPGAIVVTRESWWGHVAYVESVSGSSFTVSEMNYSGWGVVSHRTISANDSVIKGFVY